MFPYAISDQKYNDYKSVWWGYNELMVYSSKKTGTAPESGIFRKKQRIWKCDLK
jgi:hypothetical protein